MTPTIEAPFTRQMVSDFIQNRWESDEPDRVLEALRPFNGKPVTTRLLDKLPGGKARWRMIRHYGWTSIETENYTRTHGSEGVTLILVRSEQSVPLDLAKMEADNPAYFAGRRERNHARMEARNTREALDQMAAVLNRITEAQQHLDAAVEQFNQLTAHSEMFAPERYALRKLVGLDKEK